MKKKTWPWITIVGIMFAIFIAVIYLASISTPSVQPLRIGERQESLLSEVIEVIDGDTIRVRYNSSEELVRLIGIDTPEVDSPYTQEECFGPEASQKMTELLDQESVILLSDPNRSNRDRYGRLLRYVFTDQGEHVNETLIKEGYATYFPFQPFVFMDHFAKLEIQAQESNSGLWGECRG